MSSDIDEDEILRELSENVLRTTFSDLDRPVVSNTKQRLLDMVGCAIGGAGLEDVEQLMDVFRGRDSEPGATVLGYGSKLSLPDAAMVNCIMGRSFDWGPLTLVVDGERIPSHITETSVLTALAVGEYVQASGEELLTAIVVGDDLASRMWMAGGTRWDPDESSGPSTGFEQWGTVTSFASTAIAAHLFDLSVSELENAFGVVINMISGAGHGLWDGATTFKLSQGTSARSGILAAQLAESGWVGIDRPLFGERGGYFTVFDNGCGYPELLYEELGETFYTEVCFKTNPGGRPTDAPIEAAVTLVQEYGFTPRDIESVIVRPSVMAGHYTKPYEIGEYPTGDALFSYKYAAANALVRGRAINEDYTEEGIRNPDVQRTIQRTTLEELDKEKGAEVEVTLADGPTISEYVPVPPGDPSNPLTWEELEEKFRTQVEFSETISREDSQKLIEQIKSVEQLRTVTSLPELAAQ